MSRCNDISKESVAFSDGNTQVLLKRRYTRSKLQNITQYKIAVFVSTVVRTPKLTLYYLLFSLKCASHILMTSTLYAPTDAAYSYGFREQTTSIEGPSTVKCVPVTTACRVLRMGMRETPVDTEGTWKAEHSQKRQSTPGGWAE